MLPRKLALPGFLCAAVAAAFLLAWRSQQRGVREGSPGKSLASPEVKINSALTEQQTRPAGSRLQVRPEPVRDAASEAVERYLDQVKVPVIEFDGTSMEEAVDFLRLRSREIEPVGQIPPQPDYVMDREENPDAAQELPTISLQARDLSLRQAIDEIGRQTGFRVQIREGVIHFTAAKK